MVGMPPTYLLASDILGEPVVSWIARQRRPEEDLRRSWKKIAANLAEATDRRVVVSGSTVNRWARLYADRGLDGYIEGSRP